MKKISSWVEVLTTVCLNSVAINQVPLQRNASQQRNLVDGHRVLGLDHSANHHRAAISNQDVGRRLLRDQRGVQLGAGHTAEIGNGVFQVQLKKYGVVGGDLRRYLEPQECVNILDG